MERRFECDCRCWYVSTQERGGDGKRLIWAGPAHAVYFGTYEAVKEFAGGNEDGHHPFAAGNLVS